MGEHLPVTDKAAAENLIQEMKKAIESKASLETVEKLKNDLQSAAQRLNEASYQAGAAAGSAGADRNENEADVVDAEFEEN